MITTPRILYIDDEHDLLSLAASFFEDEFVPIETCTNFDEALQKIRNNSYDLIISDARLPTGSGKELLAIIKSENLNCGKVIIVTGNLDFKEDNDSGSYDLVLFKPLPFQKLVDHAKMLLKL
jgi:DNA-binding NtrC family response regulator